MAWFGWHWRGGSWQQVCEAATLVDANEAIDRARPAERDNLKLGLTTGAPPSWDPERDYPGRLPAPPDPRP